MPKSAIFDGKLNVFPDDFTDADISAALGAIPSANAASVPKAKTWTPAPSESDAGALAVKGAAAAVPGLANAAAEFATNPNVPKAFAAGGRFVGAVAPTVAGGAAGGPVGALAGAGNAAKGAWAGGKTGWFTGKLAQDIAAPIASAAEKLAPYAQAASTVAGAQGVLDLAQMADPKRTDIGFLGMGPSQKDVPDLSPSQVVMIGSQIKALTSQGMPLSEATRNVYNAWAKQLHSAQQAK